MTMSQPDDVLYRYIGPGQYWNLPDQDITRRMYDRLTPTQRRELKASAGYERLDPAAPQQDEQDPPHDPLVDAEKLNRDELNAYAASIGFPDPAGYGTKGQLVEAVQRYQQDAGEGGN